MLTQGIARDWSPHFESSSTQRFLAKWIPKQIRKGHDAEDAYFDLMAHYGTRKKPEVALEKFYTDGFSYERFCHMYEEEMQGGSVTST